MHPLLRSLLLVSGALLIPVVPLLFLGLSFEDQIKDQIADWLKVEPSPALHFVLIVLALATDIFLPVPSSMVSTYAGGSGLGIWPATLASWLGMTLGAVFGFGLARLFGEQFTKRYAGSKDLDQMTRLTQKFGPLALVLTRALPILAEACVLLMGATRLSWKRFLVPVMAANFVVSITYAACGLYFKQIDALPVAIVASGTIPLCAALFARRWLPGVEAGSMNATEENSRSSSSGGN
ncbi:MAG: VTT domain-containing protein [Planctomycetes bacterium]|nr:VTT domain-containing protein [Planctomycetota bacterium]